MFSIKTMLIIVVVDSLNMQTH